MPRAIVFFADVAQADEQDGFVLTKGIKLDCIAKLGTALK
jgi:hypothetical protein